MRAIATAVALLLAVTSASAQDFGPKDAQATPVGVLFAQTGGQWQKGEQEGFYRVLVISGGFEHVISRLYIQWIALDQDNREYKLVRTVDVKELNGGGSSVLKPSPKFADKGNWTIAVAVGSRDGKNATRTITVRPDGGYSIK
jgi:hypothetical protein